jgi:hypothetical protein
MATFTSSTFGLISGRHASAVATVSRNGKNVLRVFNAPFNPKSTKQVNQRTKFGFAMIALLCFHDVFKKTFLGMNAVSHAISLALKNSITGTSPDYSVDYPNLAFSEGGIYTPTTVSAEKTTGTSVKVDWNFFESDSSKPTDGVNLIFFHEGYQQAILNENCATRTEGTFTMDLPAEWANGAIHTWIYFSNADGSRNSMSKYICEVQL